MDTDRGAVPWLEGVLALPLCVQNLVIVSVLPILWVDKGVGQGCHMVGDQGGMEQALGGMVEVILGSEEEKCTLQVMVGGDRI